MKAVLFAAAVLSMTSVAQAADGTHLCKQGKMERSVTVVYAKEGKKAPCEVKYKRAADDEKTLFNAQTDEKFCETKAQEFVEKLKGMGWQCEG